MGDEWANLMRGSYGLGQSTGPASWEAKYLGPGALAMMGQAALPFAGQQDPQVTGTLQKGFGAPTFAGGGGAFGGGGGGSSWNLGSNPYEMARELGQAPMAQLSRNQNFAMNLLKQWQPPDLRLTGEDLLNVKMGNMTQAAAARQQAYQAALAGSGAAAQSQAAAQAAEIGSIGKLATSGINAFSSPSLSSEGYYQPSLFAQMFTSNPYGGTGGGNFWGADYSSPPSDVAPGGGAGGGS